MSTLIHQVIASLGDVSVRMEPDVEILVGRSRAAQLQLRGDDYSRDILRMVWKGDQVTLRASGRPAVTIGACFLEHGKTHTFRIAPSETLRAQFGPHVVELHALCTPPARPIPPPIPRAAIDDQTVLEPIPTRGEAHPPSNNNANRETPPEPSCSEAVSELRREIGELTEVRKRLEETIEERNARIEALVEEKGVTEASARETYHLLEESRRGAAALEARAVDVEAASRTKIDELIADLAGERRLLERLKSSLELSDQVARRSTERSEQLARENGQLKREMELLQAAASTTESRAGILEIERDRYAAEVVQLRAKQPGSQTEGASGSTYEQMWRDAMKREEELGKAREALAASYQDTLDAFSKNLRAATPEMLGELTRLVRVAREELVILRSAGTANHLSGGPKQGPAS